MLILSLAQSGYTKCISYVNINTKGDVGIMFTMDSDFKCRAPCKKKPHKTLHESIINVVLYFVAFCVNNVKSAVAPPLKVPKEHCKKWLWNLQLFTVDFTVTLLYMIFTVKYCKMYIITLFTWQNHSILSITVEITVVLFFILSFF